MRRTTSAIVVAVTAMLATAISSPAQSAPPPSRLDKPEQSLTLVTGDTVHVRTDQGGKQAATVVPGKGRERIPFLHRARGAELSIMPADAAPLVAAGKIDARLFDITGLLRDGYGDTKATSLPLIVRYRERRATALDGTTVARSLPSIGGAAITARKNMAGAFWADRADVDKVWLDAKVSAKLDQSVPKTGAPEMWAKGFTGKGITVGILDTGIDGTHPDLTDAVVTAKDFTGSESGTVDRNGHGTHVASTITGDGTASDGKYKGVAPDAKLVIGKVLDDSGQGSFSGIIVGMEWAAAQHAKVVNMSLGGDFRSDGTDPVSLALNDITRRTGTLFVVAAGNSGADEFGAHDESVGVPGVAEAALTVGAVDRDDAVVDFSSKGPRVGDGAIKPDLTAPGVDIAAARAADTQIGELVGEHYVRASGTSMASPHVAGTAAILAQQHPDWAAAQLKTALANTATPNAKDPVFHQGAGMVNVAKAGATRISATPTSVAAQRTEGAETRTVTFHNDGDAAVNLTLTLAGTAPAGTFALETSQLAVPAHGSAPATVRIDAAKAPLGRYGAWLEARSADDQRIGVPVGLVHEPKLHTIEVTGIDRRGKTTGDTMESLPWADVVDLTTGEYVPVHVSNGKIVARVPAGRYTLQAYVSTMADDGTYLDSTFLSYPELLVSKKVAIKADARKGNRVSAKTLDSPKAERFGFDMIGTTEKIGDTWIVSGTGAEDPATGLYAVPTSKVKGREYSFYYKTLRAEPLGLRAAPKAYHLGLLTQGRIPERPSYLVRDRQLAGLDTRYHLATGQAEGARFTVVGVQGEDFPSGGGTYPVTLPGRRLELYSAPEGLRLMRWLEAPDFTENAMDPPMRRGRTSTFVFNGGALGAATDTYPPKCGIGSGRFFLVSYPLAPPNALWQLPDGATKTTLHRNGELVGGTDDIGGCFEAPTTRERYTFHAVTERPETVHGIHEDATWRFDYAMDSWKAPQVVTMRMDGAFDERNTAPAGSAFRLNIRSEDTRGMTVPALPAMTKVSLSVSYDDGATWKTVQVHRAGKDRWTASVAHPPMAATNGFVAVRLSAHDKAGTGVDKTTIRSYGLR